MEKMGGLRTKMPLVFWTFLIGALSLSAFPLITAGYYSKDRDPLRRLGVQRRQPGGCGPGGGWRQILTGLYSFRMVFLIFFGQEKPPPVKVGGLVYTIPLVTLAILSLLAGLVRIPTGTGAALPLTAFVQQVLPPLQQRYVDPLVKLILHLDAPLASLVGIALAYFYFLRAPARAERWAHSPTGALWTQLWVTGWGFDRLYRTLFVRPYRRLAELDRHDIIDSVYTGLAALMLGWYRLFSHTQNGRLRRYATAVVLGAVLLLALLLYLGAFSAPYNNRPRIPSPGCGRHRRAEVKRTASGLVWCFK